MIFNEVQELYWRSYNTEIIRTWRSYNTEIIRTHKIIQYRDYKNFIEDHIIQIIQYRDYKNFIEDHTIQRL